MAAADGLIAALSFSEEVLICFSSKGTERCKCEIGKESERSGSRGFKASL